jgi:hypothetical protein
MVATVTLLQPNLRTCRTIMKNQSELLKYLGKRPNATCAYREVDNDEGSL